MIAAASITHDSGFHINPKNLRILLSWRQFPHQQSTNHSLNVPPYQPITGKIKRTRPLSPQVCCNQRWPIFPPPPLWWNHLADTSRSGKPLQSKYSPARRKHNQTPKKPKFCNQPRTQTHPKKAIPIKKFNKKRTPNKGKTNKRTALFFFLPNQQLPSPQLPSPQLYYYHHSSSFLLVTPPPPVHQLLQLLRNFNNNETAPKSAIWAKKKIQKRKKGREDRKISERRNNDNPIFLQRKGQNPGFT